MITKKKVILLLVVGVVLAKGLMEQFDVHPPEELMLYDEHFDRREEEYNYLVDKYGDHFIVSDSLLASIDYPDFSIAVSYEVADGIGMDNYAICLRQEELEGIIKEASEPILGNCKVYLYRATPTDIDTSADIDALSILTNKKLVAFHIFVEDNGTVKEDYEVWKTKMKELQYRFGYHVYLIQKDDFENIDRKINIKEGTWLMGGSINLDNSYEHKWREY